MRAAPRGGSSGQSAREGGSAHARRQELPAVVRRAHARALPAPPRHLFTQAQCGEKLRPRAPARRRAKGERAGQSRRGGAGPRTRAGRRDRKRRGGRHGGAPRVARPAPPARALLRRALPAAERVARAVPENPAQQNARLRHRRRLRHGAWGEALFLLLQTLTIGFLIQHFGGHTGRAAAGGHQLPAGPHGAALGGLHRPPAGGGPGPHLHLPAGDGGRAADLDLRRLGRLQRAAAGPGALLRGGPGPPPQGGLSPPPRDPQPPGEPPPTITRWGLEGLWAPPQSAGPRWGWGRGWDPPWTPACPPRRKAGGSRGSRRPTPPSPPHGPPNKGAPALPPHLGCSSFLITGNN
ncbi:mannose-P-dolichol utilization defect 1 protein isoform X1 [Phalacrocorax carbo]|uniref:mannose-P-dolichol utilization defect 1 protein isoform X1 n=1 Tax=Phalacrocorax carbo TaxID=9209 RepID=UPI00311A5A44